MCISRSEHREWHIQLLSSLKDCSLFLRRHPKILFHAIVVRNEYRTSSSGTSICLRSCAPSC